MTFTSPTDPLKITQSASGVSTATEFDLTFEVINDFSGQVIYSEALPTFTVVDCADATGAELTFTSGGAVADTDGVVGTEFDWNITGDSSFYLELQPISHNNALCGSSLTTSISVDDSSYGIKDENSGQVDFDASIQTTEKTIAVTFTVTNSFGASI